MKTKSLLHVAAALLLLTFNDQLSIALAQGSLTPPGAPTPTMKSLDQVEPRTPISSLPFGANTPGSYYLTTNLTGSEIEVFGDNVTIDLNGFTFSGGASGFAIVGFSGNNLVVKNGTITGCASGGVAIETPDSNNSRFENLKVINNSGYGLEVGNGSVVLNSTFSSNRLTGLHAFGKAGVMVKNCEFDNNGASGGSGMDIGDKAIVDGCIFTTNTSNPSLQTGAGCLIKDCTLTGNNTTAVSTGDGCILLNCIVRSNTFNGLFTGNHCTVKNCLVAQNAHVGITCGNDSTISGCTVVSNSLNGIIAGFGGKISDSIVSYNVSTGILAQAGSAIENCTARKNGAGIIGLSDSSISHCNSVSNSNSGIVAGAGARINDCTANNNSPGNGIEIGTNGIVMDSTAFANSRTGIVAVTGCIIKNCTASQNTGDGIFALDGSKIIGSAANTNGNLGIDVNAPGTLGSLSLVQECVATKNVNGGIRVFEGSLVENCTASLNGGTGIDAATTNGTFTVGSTVSHCTVNYNAGDGIRVIAGCYVFDNNCMGNGFSSGSPGFGNGYGIRVNSFSAGANRIEGNHAVLNTRGIDCSGSSGNLVIRNSARGNISGNYNTGFGNIVGLIINSLTISTNTSPEANYDLN